MDTKKLRANVAIQTAELPARLRRHDRSNHGAGYDPQKILARWRAALKSLSFNDLHLAKPARHLASWRAAQKKGALLPSQYLRAKRFEHILWIEAKRIVAAAANLLDPKVASRLLQARACLFFLVVHERS